MDTLTNTLARVRAFLQPRGGSFASPKINVPDLVLRSIPPQDAIDIDDLLTVLRMADDCRAAEAKGDEAIELRNALGINSATTTAGAVRDASLIRRRCDELESIVSAAHLAAGLSHTTPASRIPDAIESVKSSNDNRGKVLADVGKALGMPNGSIHELAAAAQILCNFAKQVGAAFNAPDNAPLADVFTSVYRAKGERDEFAAALREIREIVGLHVGDQVDEVLDGVRRVKADLTAANAEHGELVRELQQERETRKQAEHERTELQAQLDREADSRRRAQIQLTDLKGHCARIEAENQRYRGSTLDAKAAHERRIGPGLHPSGSAPLQDDALVAGVLDLMARRAPSWATRVAVDQNGDVFAFANQPMMVDSGDPEGGYWGIRADADRCELIGRLGFKVSGWKLTERTVNKQFVNTARAAANDWPGLAPVAAEGC